MDSPRFQERTLASKNDNQLSFTLYYPKNENNKGRAILIAPAMAVLQRYYKNFATYLTSFGFTTITFDYLGIGKSQIQNLKDKSITYQDWAVHDLNLLIDWISTHISKDITFIGHSASGQLLGLCPSNFKLKKVFIVGSGVGNWKNWPFPRNIAIWLVFYVVYPFFLRLYGYSPKFAMGENVPIGIIRQWLKWGRKKNFMLDFPEIVEKSYFDKLTPHLTFIHFADDSYAPYKSSKKLFSFYEKYNPQAEFNHYKPKTLGFNKIGHFGFFKKKYDSLWYLIIEKL